MVVFFCRRWCLSVVVLVMIMVTSFSHEYSFLFCCGSLGVCSILLRSFAFFAPSTFFFFFLDVRVYTSSRFRSIRFFSFCLPFLAFFLALVRFFAQMTFCFFVFLLFILRRIGLFLLFFILDFFFPYFLPHVFCFWRRRLALSTWCSWMSKRGERRTACPSRLPPPRRTLSDPPQRKRTFASCC